MIVILDIAKLMTAGQFNQVMLSVGRLASKRDHKISYNFNIAD
jgi:hypothetical protein